MARENAVRSVSRVGMKFGVLLPFAHFGVPQIVIRTSMSRACVLRTSSSRSLKRYAGSNGFDAFAGRVGATFAQVTRVRTIVALASRAWSSISARRSSYRKFGSSWKPRYMRGAAPATEGASRRTADAASRNRMGRFTGKTPFGWDRSGLVFPNRAPR